MFLQGALEVFHAPEVGIIGVFVLLKYEYELETGTNDIGFNSVNLDKFIFVFKLNWLATNSKNIIAFQR